MSIAISTTNYKAIIFDLGGVCVGSPMQGISKYEKEHGLPPNYINVAIVKRGENGAFQRFERGELLIPKFYEIFGNELSDPINKEYYQQYLSSRNGGNNSSPSSSKIPSITVDGKLLFRYMISETLIIDPTVFYALKCLRASNKYKIAALTNNFPAPVHEVDRKEVAAWGRGGEGGVPTPIEELYEMFHVIVESSVVGLRKPDPKIFLLACEQLKVSPKEAIFLDDIGINLKSAKNLGMKTIKVELGKSAEAIRQLEAIVGLLLFEQKKNVSLL
ncbi:3331_t:CDS:2 [Ambispora gerdemannii]|uniref:3331_t:CDS:1 n=1 Tax=Ambispora gerdemannii TaxID=144530 RepID=A0A9N9ALU4_9GLOM|nr:3331_t:CDS:2 [Ambispora gerdemannii]